MNTQTTITKKEWINRCATRLTGRGGLHPEQAVMVADALWLSEDDPLSPDAMTPEDVAEADMDEWSANSDL